MDGHQPAQKKRYKNGVSLCGSRQQLSKVQLELVTVEDSEISVCNLGACLMDIHVSKVCSKALRDLYFIRQIRKYLSEDANKVLVHAFVTSRVDYCNYLLFGFQNTNVIRCRGFLAAAAAAARIVCLVPKVSHHTPVYIGYQCPSASSATRPPSSRWCWPCLPKEVSKIQGKWSLQFKIQCQLRIKGPQNKVRDPWGQGLLALVVEHSPFSYQEYLECSGFQAGSKDLLISFSICLLNQFTYSDCDVLFSFSLSGCHV